MTTGDLVPIVDAELVPDVPAWRQFVERATTVTVAVAGAMTHHNDDDDEHPSAAAGLVDTALGVALESQRVALDVTERLVDTGATLARFTVRLPFVREMVSETARALEPARERGEAAREVAVRRLGANMPNVVSGVADSALDVIDLNQVLQHVDVQGIIDRVDVQQIIDRVDIDGIVGRVDIDGIVAKVDLDTLLTKVDVQGIIDRVDLNEIVGKVDIDSLVSQTDLGAIIAQSTGGMASGAVDMVRRQGVGLDSFVDRWAKRIRRRHLRDAPLGPPLLVTPNGPAPVSETAAT